MLNALIAIAAVLVALALIGAVVSLVLAAAGAPLGGLLERRRLARHMACARRGDHHLQAGAGARALVEFQAAFYPYAPRTGSAANAIAAHHAGLLSRLIAVADCGAGPRVRLISLAKADRLFQERNALQRRVLAARQSGPPQRLREVRREFHANTREIRATLAALAAEISAAREPRRLH